MSSTAAANSCVFEPQHYRPNVCKSCFCAKSTHSNFAAPAPAALPASTSSNATSSSPFKRNSIIASAKITPAATNTPQLDTQTQLKVNASSSSASLAAASSSRLAVAQATSVAQEHKEKVEDENGNNNEDDGNDDDEDEELHVVPEDAEQEAWGSVPQAPSILPPPVATAAPRSNRSQSVSVTRLSSSRSPPSTVDVRSSLLNSIQSGTTLRRASEQRPLAEKPLAMDINSELTWTLKKKKKLEEEAKKKELGATTLGTLLPEEKDEFQRLGQRLTHLGVSYSHPATLDSVREFVADLQGFSVRNAATLPLIRAGSSASSVSAPSPSSAPSATSAASIASSSNAAASLLTNIDFESVESSIAWPTVRFNCILDTLKLLERIAVCETHVSKYTTAFEKYKREKEAVEQKIARGAAAAPNSAALNGRAAPVVSMDCFIIDAQIVCQALENLLNAMKAYIDFKHKSESEDIIYMIDPLPAAALAEEATNPSLHDLSTTYVLRRAQQIAVCMLDLLFEKSKLAYQASATAAASVSTPISTDSSSSSSERVKSNLIPHYSQTSKAIKNYQALELTLTLFQRMLGARFQTTLVPMPLEIRQTADELIQLKNDIEASEAYKTCIAVVQRKGQWDKKEEVQLRRLSRNMSFEAPSATSSSSALGSPSSGRRESLTVAASAVAGAHTLRSMKESYPQLFALLENATQDEKWMRDFSNALQELVAKQVPISLITLFTLRHVIPAHNSAAFRLLLSHVFIPHHHQLSQQEFSESKLKATQELQDSCVGILHECAAKGFRDGVQMCIAPLSPSIESTSGGLDDDADLSKHDASQVGLGVDPNARLSTSSSYTLGGANTAMHLAASNSHVAVMAMLLRAGANPLIINSFERTPLFHLHQLFQHNSKPAETNDASSVVSSSLMSFLSRYFNNSRLADVRLRIEDEATGRVVIFPAHRLVLCGQSEVFRAMLEEGAAQWASPAVNQSVADSESLDAEEVPVDPSNSLPLIPIPDVPSIAAFQLFLQAMYTGALVFTNDDLNAAAGVLTLSSRFLTDSIRTIAARHLAKKVHAANAEGIYNLAKLTNEVSLKHQVEAFIIENYSEGLSSELHLTSGDGVDSAHPHAFLLRVLEGMDVDALKQGAQAKRPNWHV